MALAQHNWAQARKVLAVVFMLGALYATVVSGLWFITDFIAASVYSPNLDQAQQVADFNDLSYISDTLAHYRFPLGFKALIMAIALLALAAAITDRRSRPKPVFIAGGIALLAQALLLAHAFIWPIAFMFLATALALYIATEFDAVEETASDETASADLLTEDRVEPVASSSELPVIGEPEVDSDSEERKEPVVPTALVTVDEPEEVAEEIQEPDTDAVEALGLEIESDLNLDLEQDYELANSEEQETDPLVLLSQADLGIEDDSPIETAAAIEREIGIDIPLDQADTAEIQAFIDSAEDEDEEQVREVATPTATLDGATEESPVVAVPGEAVEEGSIDFDPGELARQEALLPPPRKKVWNMLDWTILTIIILSIVALFLF
jgi:hypothetical protein